MCFIINSKYPEEKIAKKDIVCYKVLKPTLESIIYSKVYKLNKLYKTTLDKPKESLIVSSYISRGFHSYSNKKEVFRWVRIDYRSVIKGIIPKGSEYYYNPTTHEYVSNQIILQEIIK